MAVLHDPLVSSLAWPASSCGSLDVHPSHYQSGDNQPRPAHLRHRNNPQAAWSQASERRIGEDGLLARRRPTLLFNGYEAQVGQLYAGMDLKEFY